MNKQISRWVYRIAASIVILSLPFVIVFTAMFFTPGLASDTHNCPSAFSNSGAKIDARDEATLKRIVRNDNVATKSTVAYLPKIKNSDPVIKNKALMEFLLDEVVIPTEKQSNDHQVDRYWKDVTEQACREEISSRRTFVDGLSTRNIVAAIAIEILIVSAFFLTKKRLFGQHQKLHIVPRVIALSLILFICGYYVVMPLVSDDYKFVTESDSCTVSKAFDVHHPVSATKSQYFKSLDISGVALTRTDEEEKELLVKSYGKKATAEQRNQMTQNYSKVRSEYLTYLNKAKEDPDFAKTISNEKLADPDCIANARYDIFVTIYFLLVAAGVLVFSFGSRGRKERDPSTSSG